MWNQWSQYEGAPPLPTTAPPPPPKEPATVAPPSQSLVPVGPPQQPSLSSPATCPIIGPVLPGVVATTAIAAGPMPAALQTASLGTTVVPTVGGENPYSQYTAAQYAAMTPEQQFALQQHWQQWQKYQEEYARWHVQYGEQYKREMEIAAAATSNYSTYYQQQPPPAQAVAKITGQPQLYTQPPPPQEPTTITQTNPMNYPPLGTGGPTALLLQQPPPWTQHQQQQRQLQLQAPPQSFTQPPPNYNKQIGKLNDPNVNAQHMNQPPWSGQQGVPVAAVTPQNIGQSNDNNSDNNRDRNNRSNSGNRGSNNSNNSQDNMGSYNMGRGGPNNNWQGGSQNNNRGGNGPDNWNNNQTGSRENFSNNRGGNNWNNNNTNSPQNNWNDQGSNNRIMGNIGSDQGNRHPETDTIEPEDENPSEEARNMGSEDRNVFTDAENIVPDDDQNMAPDEENIVEQDDWNNRGGFNNDTANNCGSNDWKNGSNEWNNDSNEWNNGSNNRGRSVSNDRNFGRNNRGPNDRNFNNNNRGPNNWNDGPNNRGNNTSNDRNFGNRENWNDGPNNRGNNRPNNWNDGSNNRTPFNRGNNRSNDWNDGPNNRGGPNNWNDGPNNRGGTNNWNDSPNNWNDIRGNNRPNDRNFGNNDWNDGPNSRGPNDRNFGPNNRGNNRSNEWNDVPNNRGNNRPNEWNDGPNNRGRDSRGPNNGPDGPDNHGRDSRGSNNGPDGPDNHGRVSRGPYNGPDGPDNRRRDSSGGPDGPYNRANRPTNNQNQSGGTGGNNGPAGRVRDLDEEMFDKQFRQWEQQFDDWKQANANHPDRDMYKRYEIEFENQRKRIMDRREQMRRRKLEQMGLDPNQPHPTEPSPNSSRDRDCVQNENTESRDSFGRIRRDSICSQSRESFGNQQQQQNKNSFESINKNTEQELKASEPIEIPDDNLSQSQNQDSQEGCQKQENEGIKADVSNKDRQEGWQILDNEAMKGVATNKDTQQMKSYQEKPAGSSTQLGKRKSRFNAPTPTIKIKPTEQDVINLDDDEESESVKASQSHQGNMSEIFKKVDGIPGLDLTGNDDAVATTEPSGKITAKPEPKMDVEKIAAAVPVSTAKKIPSLFDIKVDKPDMSEMVENKNPSSTTTAPVAIPDLAKSLNDPDFLKKISEAVAQAQGVGETNKMQDNEGRTLSFAEWQQRKQIGGSVVEMKNAENSVDNMELESTHSTDSFRDKISNKSEVGDEVALNLNAGSGDGSSGPPVMGANNMINNMGHNMGPDEPNNWRPNYQAPNGPNSWGPNGPDNFGPNNTNNNNNNFRGGPNSGNFGPSGPYAPGRQIGRDGPDYLNFGRDGPGYNFSTGGPERNFGRDGPNFGASGPPRNFGPDGAGRQCGRDGPVGSNFGPFGGPGRNFGPNGGPGRNFGCDGPDGTNFGPNGGQGRNFGRNDNPDGPYFGPNAGQGRNFGRNNNPDGKNFGPNGGQGRNFGRNDNDGTNFGPNGGQGRNFGRNDNSDGINFGPNGGQGRNFVRNDNPDARNFGRNDNAGGNRRSFAPNIQDMGGPNSDGGPPARNNSNNPFRRTDGPANAASFDVDDRDNMPQNQKESWIKGPDGGANLDYDSFYRPMQVIDYTNNTPTTIAPKVIDYGHKPVMPVVNEGFKPLKIINYDHASKTRVQQSTQQQRLTAAQKRKNNKKNKNKNNMPQQHTNQQGQNRQPPKNQTNQNNNQKDLQQHNNTDDNDEAVLDDISDTDDIPNEPGSPPPPPPPMLSCGGVFMPSTAQAAGTSIFPSTAEANENLPKMSSTHVQMSIPTEENNNTISIDEIILKPGRQTRPKKICVILRGPPGSGKSHVAKLIKEKEKEMGGNNPRILSIDDYFLIENDYEEKCPKTGKKIPKKEILYEYDKAMEEKYLEYVIKVYKKTIADNLYDFIIIDCNNNSLRSLNEFYCHSKDSGYVPYIVDLICDLETCMSRNIHDRSEKDIEDIIATWKSTPDHYIKLDISSLLENVVEMEDAEDMAVDDNTFSENTDSNMMLQTVDEADDNIDAVKDNNENDNENQDEDDSNDSIANCGFLKSKWETDTTTENLARLDGTSKMSTKRKPTMEDFLQMDEWQPRTNTKGKKRVRWADIEEKREQEKMRAVGFVVGQTDWKRMMDPNAGKRALNKTKYIERVNKRR